jgi:hypothetical protein
LSSVLPIEQTGPWFQFQTELDGVTYGFEFRWNEREGYWFCTLSDGEGNPIVSGRKVVLGPLFKKFRSREPVWPAADVYALDTGSGDVDAGFADLGRRVILIYATDEEIAASASANG